MRRFIFSISVLFISAYCFSQQNLPSRIFGDIPNPNSAALYQIQVGAYSSTQNAAVVSNQLKSGGLNPVSENHQHLTRVLIKGIPSAEVTSRLERIKRLGFNEVIIREDRGGSGYSSSSGYSEFPGYGYTSSDVMYINDHDNIRIRRPDGTEIDISFAKAAKTQDMDFFYRKWKVVNCTQKEFIGDIFHFSNNGTYLISKNDGRSRQARWRWCDDQYEEWEYTHHNWESYGKVKINSLSPDLLVFSSPNYFASIEGYSSSNQDDVYELVPVRE